VSVLAVIGLISVLGTGYVLAAKPSDIKVGTILRALEGDLSLIDENSDSAASGNTIQTCIRINVWDKLNQSLTQVVDTLTLEDLVNEHRKLSGEENIMYYI
jgi:DNA-binding IscR family transcriptional regulator